MYFLICCHRRKYFFVLKNLFHKVRKSVKEIPFFRKRYKNKRIFYDINKKKAKIKHIFARKKETIATGFDRFHKQVMLYCVYPKS